MRSLTSLFVLILWVFGSGCAGIKVYKDPNLKHETAIKVHLPKPFLLVERSPAKDVGIKATIIFLPDLAEPIYVKAKNGMGTSNLTLNLEKGYLSQYGAVTDSKVPETITAVSGLATAFLPLIAPESATAEAATAALQGANVEDLIKVETLLVNIKKDVETATGNEMTSNQVNEKAKLSEQLQKAIDIAKEHKPTRNDELTKLLEGCLKMLENLSFSEPQSEAKKRHNDWFTKLKMELESAIGIVKPAVTLVGPSIELYEILYSNSPKGYSLKKVNL